MNVIIMSYGDVKEFASDLLKVSKNNIVIVILSIIVVALFSFILYVI